MATGSEGAFPARTEAKTLRELEEESMRVAKEVKNWEIETVLHFLQKKRNYDVGHSIIFKIKFQIRRRPYFLFFISLFIKIPF